MRLEIPTSFIDGLPLAKTDSAIENGDGCLLTNQKEIETEILDYFEKLYAVRVEEGLIF